MKSPVVTQILARYSKKLAKNQALQLEIENVYQKLMAFPDGTNTEVLKLLCRLEKRLLKIKEQNQNIQAIIEVLEKPAVTMPSKPVATPIKFIPQATNLQPVEVISQKVLSVALVPRTKYAEAG